jgi:glycine cleavage system aminomethyltransferase T
MMMMNSIAKASRSSTSAVARRTFAAAAAGSEDLVQTALYDLHKELGGEMVPFAGYELPVLFKGDHVENGGVMKEHLWCRAAGKAALFDVSHMGQVRFVYVDVDVENAVEVYVHFVENAVDVRLLRPWYPNVL